MCLRFFVLWTVSFIGFTQSAKRVDVGARMQAYMDTLSPSHDKRSFKENPKQLLQLGKNENLVQKDVVKTFKGHTKIRFAETYMGIPVYGTVVTADLDNSSDVTGWVIEEIENDVTSIIPDIPVNRAKDIAVHYAGLHSQNEIYNVKIELVILLKDVKARLCYYITFVVDVSLSRMYFFIDANSGKVIDSWEGITTAEISGNGGNEISGLVTYGQNCLDFLNLTEQSGVCTYENFETIVVNLQQGTNTSNLTPYSVSCPNNSVGSPDAINGGVSAANDAFFSAKIVKEMYKQWFNISLLGEKLQLKVHLGQNYSQAFWDGSAVLFGDGGLDYYPMVSLDITAHELSHGFTEQHSALEYRGQSGGINEAFSDMAGEAAEFFLTGSNDWGVGSDIVKSGGALRYMDNPPLNDGSIDHISDYQPSMDVHDSSGIYNKAFYTLATNPGWNTKEAFRVFLEANRMYWSPTTTFLEGACGVLRAATDLGLSTEDVKSAFGVVGVVPEVSCSYGNQNDDVVLLTSFVGVEGLIAQTGESLDFKVDIPLGASYLFITAEGNNGYFNLYVKYNTKPTSTSYDQKASDDGHYELIQIFSPTVGEYYIMLYAVEAFTQVTLTAYF